MLEFRQVLATALCVASVAVALCPSQIEGRFVMPWICADASPCGNNKAVLQTQIQQLSSVVNGTQVFTDAAFENYGIASGNIIRQPTALDVAGDISKQGVHTWAMVFSTSIAEMRRCWSDTAGFIKSFTTAVVQGPGGKHVQGLNLDWEPDSMTSEDGKNFAKFLDQVSTALHSLGMKVSVAGIRGGALWDYTLIGKTAVDYVMDMNTYMDGQNGNPPPSDFSYFKEQVKACLSDLRPEQYVVCIEDNLSLAQLQERISFMQHQGVRKVALWLSHLAEPLPTQYFPYFANL